MADINIIDVYRWLVDAISEAFTALEVLLDDLRRGYY